MARRFKDRKTVGRSEIVPFIPGESARRRHKRRLKTNREQFEDVAKEWCAARDITLMVANRGHHWKFAKDRMVVEWWPSSAKFVFDKQYNKGVHVHDWTQAKVLIAGYWNCAEDRHGNVDEGEVSLLPMAVDPEVARAPARPKLTASEAAAMRRNGLSPKRCAGCGKTPGIGSEFCRKCARDNRLEEGR